MIECDGGQKTDLVTGFFCKCGGGFDRLFILVQPQCAVIGFDSAGESGCRGGGIGCFIKYIIGLEFAFDRHGIHVQFCMYACQFDGILTHAVADHQEHIFRRMAVSLRCCCTCLQKEQQ